MASMKSTCVCHHVPALTSRVKDSRANISLPFSKILQIGGGQSCLHRFCRGLKCHWTSSFLPVMVKLLTRPWRIVILVDLFQVATQWKISRLRYPYGRYFSSDRSWLILAIDGRRGRGRGRGVHRSDPNCVSLESFSRSLNWYGDVLQLRITVNPEYFVALNFRMLGPPVYLTFRLGLHQADVNQIGERIGTKSDKFLL